jgi:uncharacterized protein
MADELLETYIRQLIEAHATVAEVTIAWQGGEPTMMGLDFFRRSVELAQRYLRPGQRATYTIQTNGTLLDYEWGVFLKEHSFLVGLSIDGPRGMHDRYRVDNGGKGSFDRVMASMRVLQEQGVEWNALTTIHAANQDNGHEVYRFLRYECEARFMQFIPIVERATPQTLPVANEGWGDKVRDRPPYTQESELVTERSISPEGYGRFLIDVFEEWVRRDVGEVYVQMFDVALANWVGEPPGLCVYSETCGLALHAGAHGRPVLVRSLRRARVQARQHEGQAPARADRPAAAEPAPSRAATPCPSRSPRRARWRAPAPGSGSRRRRPGSGRRSRPRPRARS